MTDPRIQARRVRVERQRGHRRLGVVFAVLVLIGVSAGGVAILHSRFFAARTVVIAGAVHTSRAEIIATSGLASEPPLVSVDPGAITKRLERLPWVLTANVHVQWPSTVAIAVEERVPVATSRLGSGAYALFDSTGRVLADESSRPVGLPLVSLQGASSAPGRTLGTSARLLLAAAAQLPASLVPRVDEMVETSADGVVLHLGDGLRAVVGDDEALAEKFVSLATVLQRVDLSDVGGIDLRVASSPVLTPLVSPSNVQGKGDG
ncbi:MAG: FtsQ-type POTRA domain-containing protein [Acidimicrobiales bacterium]|jgi:cell division protein FtsQ